MDVSQASRVLSRVFVDDHPDEFWCLDAGDNEADGQPVVISEVGA
jgi:hypothetical protein